MLQRSTIRFLSDLVENNDRSWFQENKSAYEAAKADTLALTRTLHQLMIGIDPLVGRTVDPAKALMRIYRDVRFSKNKDPYKKNFGIWFPAYANVSAGPGYYLHVEPGKSFIGAGYWMPESAHLKMIREEIDYNGAQFRDMANGPLTSVFHFNYSDSLKNAPKGYDPGHPDVKYLKLKSFEVSRTVTDKELFSRDLAQKLVADFKLVVPFVDFLREAITPESV